MSMLFIQFNNVKSKEIISGFLVSTIATTAVSCHRPKPQPDFYIPESLKKFPSPAQNILKNLLLIPTALPSPLTMVMIMKTLKKF